MVVHGLRGQKGNIFFPFAGHFHYYSERGYGFLEVIGELGIYSRQKSLIKENYIRNQRGSFPIGPMLTRSGNVYVIKTQFHLPRRYYHPGKTH